MIHHPIVNKAIPPNSEIPESCVGVRGKLYLVHELLPHPGGAAFIHLAAGTDATALFETHHLNIQKAEARLPSSVGTYTSCVTEYDFTAYSHLRSQMLTRFPTRQSRRMRFHDRLIMHSCIIATLLLHVYAVTFRTASLQWLGACIASGIFNTLCGGFGHNGVHSLHPSACLLDWNGLSSFEWLFEHIASHHMFVNTKHDHDAISMEPFVVWIPGRQKPWLPPMGKHLIYAIAEFAVAIQGNLGHRLRWKADDRFPMWMRLAPWFFVLRITSYLAAGWFGLCSAALTLLVAGYSFAFLAHLNHVYGGNGLPDFVNQQMINTRDLKPGIGAGILFLDRQRNHHLFPSVDQTLLA